jgi:hypothetical protein
VLPKECAGLMLPASWVVLKPLGWSVASASVPGSISNPYLSAKRGRTLRTGFIVQSWHTQSSWGAAPMLPACYQPSKSVSEPFTANQCLKETAVPTRVLRRRLGQDLIQKQELRGRRSLTASVNALCGFLLCARMPSKRGPAALACSWRLFQPASRCIPRPLGCPSCRVRGQIH